MVCAMLAAARVWRCLGFDSLECGQGSTNETQLYHRKDGAMKLTTTHNHVRRLENRIRDIYSKAKIYTLDSDSMFAELNQYVWGDSAFQRLPTWAQSHIGGFEKAMFDCLFKYELETRCNLNGQWILGKDVPKGQWANVTAGGRFYWKGTDTPFSKGE